MSPWRFLGPDICEDTKVNSCDPDLLTERGNTKYIFRTGQSSIWILVKELFAASRRRAERIIDMAALSQYTNQEIIFPMLEKNNFYRVLG